MTPSNTENLNTTPAFLNNSTRRKIIKCEEENIKDNGYRHIAKGVLQRVGIHPAQRDLSTILGECTPRNNLDAVIEWILEDDREIERFSRNEIEKYTEKLRNLLREFYEG